MPFPGKAVALHIWSLSWELLLQHCMSCQQNQPAFGSDQYLDASEKIQTPCYTPQAIVNCRAQDRAFLIPIANFTMENQIKV